jgi:hypothetical protein
MDVASAALASGAEINRRDEPGRCGHRFIILSGRRTCDHEVPQRMRTLNHLLNNRCPRILTRSLPSELLLWLSVRDLAAKSAFKSLRAHPGSLDSCRGICGSKTPEHDADHCEADERDNRCGVAFEIAGEPTVATDPGKGSLHEPSLGQDLEAIGIGSLYDLQLPRSSAPNQSAIFSPA